MDYVLETAQTICLAALWVTCFALYMEMRKMANRDAVIDCTKCGFTHLNDGKCPGDDLMSESPAEDRIDELTTLVPEDDPRVKPVLLFLQTTYGHLPEDAGGPEWTEFDARQIIAAVDKARK